MTLYILYTKTPAFIFQFIISALFRIMKWIWTFAPPLSDVICYHCNLLLSSSTDILLRHSKTCSSVDRPDKTYKYVCCLCENLNYKTYYSTSMLSHIRSHLGDKSFKCPHCTYQSTQPQHLKRHIRMRHESWCFP